MAGRADPALRMVVTHCLEPARVQALSLRSLYVESRGLIVVEDSGEGRGCRRSGCVGALEHVANQPIAHHVLDMLE